MSFPILDVVLGLSFIYLLLALVASTLTEWLAQFRNSRGTMLADGLAAAFGEAGERHRAITEEFLREPLIRSLAQPGRMPSYIPSSLFAQTLLRMLRTRQIASITASTNGRSALLETLATLADDGRDNSGSSADATSNPVPSAEVIANWFDRCMERTSGTYKRQARRRVFAVAVVVAVALNANSFSLIDLLWASPTLRATVVEHARTRFEEGRPLESIEYTEPDDPSPSAPDTSDAASGTNTLLAEEQELLGTLFGWASEAARIERYREKWGGAGSASGAALWFGNALAGWLITALAVSLGAPFWFDAMGRILKLRSSGQAPPKAARAAEEGVG